MALPSFPAFVITMAGNEGQAFATRQSAHMLARAQTCRSILNAGDFLASYD